MSNTVTIAMPVLLERLRLQAHVRRLITEHGQDAAAQIIADALARELKQPHDTTQHQSLQHHTQ